MKKFVFCLFATFFAIFLASCDNFEGDQTIPAYITIDKILVEENPVLSGPNVPKQDSGFLSSDINTVEVIVNTGTKIGVFELPCTIPILQQGDCDILLYPCVKQNGMSATRISYPFYKEVQGFAQKVRLVPGETTVLNPTLYTQYTDNGGFFLRTENFEETSHVLDSTVTFYKTGDGDIAVKYGKRCGIIRVPDSVTAIESSFSKSFTSSKYDALYLELDYACNTSFEVGLGANITTGYTEYSAMRLYSTNGEWKKIYISLGKVWSALSYPNEFEVKFWTLNPDKSSKAWVCLDNIKVMNK